MGNTTRHTIRKYTDRKIDEQLLYDMLEEASHAPTTGNMQWYSVVITRSKEGKQALAPAHFNQPQVTGCDTVLTFCADVNRFTLWCNERKASPGYNNLQSLVAAALDTMCVAQQFNTIAESNGLGCCMLGTTTYNAQEIANVLGLPKLVVPIITITVGYPDESPVDCGRLPVGGFVHAEKYKDYSPADIDRIYAEKEARADSREFVTENNKETLAQVFTDIRYTREAGEFFSEKFANYIKEAGF